METGFVNKRECFHSCLNNKTEKTFKESSFSVIETSPSNKNIINRAQIENRTFSAILTKLEKDCTSKCSQPNCVSRLTLSSLLKEDDYMEGGISFLINVPKSPSFFVIHQPHQDITDFLVYVLSSFGTWFGISVMSCNPRIIMEEYREWRKNHNRSTRVRTMSLDSDPCKCCGSIRSSLRNEIKMEIDLTKKFVVQMKYNSNYIQLMLDRIPVRLMSPLVYH